MVCTGTRENRRENSETAQLQLATADSSRQLDYSSITALTARDDFKTAGDSSETAVLVKTLTTKPCELGRNGNYAETADCAAVRKKP